MTVNLVSHVALLALGRVDAACAQWGLTCSKSKDRRTITVHRTVNGEERTVGVKAPFNSDGMSDADIVWWLLSCGTIGEKSFEDFCAVWHRPKTLTVLEQCEAEYARCVRLASRLRWLFEDLEEVTSVDGTVLRQEDLRLHPDYDEPIISECRPSWRPDSDRVESAINSVEEAEELEATRSINIHEQQTLLFKEQPQSADQVRELNNVRVQTVEVFERDASAPSLKVRLGRIETLVRTTQVVEFDGVLYPVETTPTGTAIVVRRR